MKNNKLIILITMLQLFALFTLNSYGDVLGYPKNDNLYNNPYEMMHSEAIGKIENHNEYLTWTVIANKQNAKLFMNTGGMFEENGHYADYLQLFHVLSRNGYYLEVKALNKPLKENQWLHMKDLILLERSIKNPKSQIYMKAHPLVKLDSFDNMNAIKLRNGPGETRNHYSKTNAYQYLDTIRVGDIFLYIYGVYFDEKNDNYLESYFHIDNYKDAKYFLVGKTAGLCPEEAGETILGWLPNESIVLWPSRQGLDVIPDRKHNWAHIFSQEDQIQKYFIAKNKSNEYIKKIKDLIVQDKGGMLSFCSGSMKPIVIDHPLHNEDLEYANIGYSSRKNVKSVTRHEDQKEQITLADLRKLSKNIEVYFLLDATKSMDSCFRASAIIVQEIMDHLSGYDCQFYAGIYRDTNDGIHKFEEWNNDSGKSLSQWLNTVETKTFKGPDNDYQELLYYGIFQAVKSWRKKFKTKIGIRMMLIIGDTGNTEYNKTTIAQVSNSLTENTILPMALHFVHKPKNADEQKAIKQFKGDLRVVYKMLSTDSLIPFETVDVSDIESSIFYEYLPSQIKLKKTTNRVVIYFQRIINTYIQFIKKYIEYGLSEVILGQKSLIQMICDKGISKNSEAHEKCCKCKDLNCLIKVVSEYREYSPQDVNNDIGFPIALLKMLGDKCPECLSYLTKKPEAGFAEGYIAVKQDNHLISRPIWLLSFQELENIKYKTQSFLSHTYTGNCEGKVHKTVIDALSVIIGQSLDIQPDEITKEQIKKWFNIVIDSDRTSILPELARKLCRDTKAFLELKQKLREIPKNIKRITYDLKDEREYKSLELDSKNAYFWVYPEELFPKINW